MNSFFASKKIVILILVLAVIFFVLLIITLLVRPSNRTQAPTPAPIAPEAHPYAPGVASKDFQRIDNPQPLSETDAQVKQNFINRLENKSGGIHQTSNYDIQYVKTADQFMIEILHGDPEIAKKEAVDWLKSQGLSQEGVCNLPVMFFLGQGASDYLKANNKQFDPTPPRC